VALDSQCLNLERGCRCIRQSHEKCGRGFPFKRRRYDPASASSVLFSLTMATATETQSPSPSELTVLNRVASIPLVCDTMSALHSSLVSNPITRSPYAAAQAVSSSALRYSEPITAKLAPIIVRADGFANKGLDVVESRYPYPFKVQSEEFLKDLKESSVYARDVANKTIGERVRDPAYTAVQGIDQVCIPLSFPLHATRICSCKKAVYPCCRLFGCPLRHAGKPLSSRVKISIPARIRSFP
jgi:hypothetical protein